MVAWGDSLQLIRKTVCRLPPQTRDRPPRPLASGPGSVSKEPGGMPGFAQTPRQALQVGFGATGDGMTTADEADREAGSAHLWQHAGVLPLLDPIPNNNDKAMVGDTLKAPPRAASTTTAPRTLPKSLLYSIFARIGGSGLDTDAFETLRASYHGGFLGKAVAYDNRQTEIPATRIHSLRWHPVRLLSSLDSPDVCGANKK